MPRPAQRFKVGDLECVVFQTAATTFDVSHGFGTSASPEEVIAATLAEGRNANEYPFVINLLYVKTPQHQFLIDAGVGKSPFDPESDELANDLRGLGIDPAGIDSVIITHAHWDHYAGLHDSAGNLTFPNARYFINKIEWD